CMQVPQTPFTL
nr:immunoglobulin light chain junction region [Macaca mulatta]